MKEFGRDMYVDGSTVAECGEDIWNKFRQYIAEKCDCGAVWGAYSHAHFDTAVFIHYNYFGWESIRWVGDREKYTKRNILNILTHHGYIKQEEQPMSKFKAMKFRVKDAEHSAHIQKYLFSLGYIWRGGQTHVINTREPALITDSIGHIVWGENFANYPEQEHTLDVHMEGTYTCSPVERPRATIELNGVRYYVDDLEKALQRIKPIENS